MKDEVEFSCTSCGRCCHDLKLPLSVSEAKNWLERGGEIGVICDLMPLVDEPDPADKVSLRKKSLSFQARSGLLSVRVNLVLVAHYEGTCPHLLSDFRCGQYDLRPLACRIYPAEVNPLQVLDPSSKLCPEDAWQSKDFIPLIDHGVRNAIEAMNELAALEVSAKANLCRLLSIKSAALANQGYALHHFDRLTCMNALSELFELMRAGLLVPDQSDWSVITHRSETVDDLKSVGASFAHVHLKSPNQSLELPNLTYIGFEI